MPRSRLLSFGAVREIIEEIGVLRCRFDSRDAAEHRQAFQRLQEIETPEFARRLARAVLDSMEEAQARRCPRYPSHNGNGACRGRVDDQ